MGASKLASHMDKKKTSTLYITFPLVWYSARESSALSNVNTTLLEMNMPLGVSVISELLTNTSHM